jgi:hypothetical protein
MHYDISVLASFDVDNFRARIEYGTFWLMANSHCTRMNAETISLPCRAEAAWAKRRTTREECEGGFYAISYTLFCMNKKFRVLP